MRPALHRRLTRGALVASAVTIAATARATGQAPPGRLAAMRVLDRWIGEWRGTGWSVDATGRRTEFNLVESVQPRVGRTVLLIEGRGTATAGAAPGSVTHDGLVVLSYDDKTGRYRWQGHEVGQEAMDVEATLADGSLAWSLPVGAGGATIRFTITFEERRWHEVGEFSADGSTWNPFMEMNLLRQ